FLFLVFVYFFFFQAEDGIRDDLVTGVQTCALPICLEPEPVGDARADVTYRFRFQTKTGPYFLGDTAQPYTVTRIAGRKSTVVARSEERRVGKGCGVWRSGVTAEIPLRTVEIGVTHE